MWLLAIQIAIIFAIYPLLQKCFVDWPLARRIKRSKNVKDAIACRRKLKFRRRLFFIIYVLFFLVFPYLAQTMVAIKETGIVSPRNFLWVFILPVFLYLYLISSKNLDRLLGNLSLADKTTFLSKSKDFVLYLRGFETDDYASESKQYKKLKGRSRFSEYYFTKVLQSKAFVCAVGMTKEVDAPIGAQRVYLNDETWQEDVLDLMRSAKEIYILVNDRPSCIWEINQSLTMLDKTIFLVDEREKYSKVRQLGHEHGIMFPEMSHSAETQPHDFVAIRFKDGNADCRSYDKSLAGYAKMLGVPVPHIRKPGSIGCGASCFGVVSVFLIMLIVIAFGGIEERKAYNLPKSCDQEYELLVLNVLNNVTIPSPKNSVEVVRGSETFTELEKIDEGAVIGLKRFYHKSDSGLEDHPLNGVMDVVIAAPIYVKQKWQPSSFKRVMEKERESIVPGGILSSQTKNNYQVEGITYDKYEINSACVSVSEVSDKAFSFSILTEEELIKEDQKITLWTLETRRCVLVKGRILILRARDVFLDREEAMRQIAEQDKRLEKWNAIIEARNIGRAD